MAWPEQFARGPERPDACAKKKVATGVRGTAGLCLYRGSVHRENFYLFAGL